MLLFWVKICSGNSNNDDNDDDNDYRDSSNHDRIAGYNSRFFIGVLFFHLIMLLQTVSNTFLICDESCALHNYISLYHYGCSLVCMTISVGI